MNLEEFGYQFGVNGAENLISKLNQIETETEQLDNAVQHLGNTFQKFFDLSLRSAIPPAFIKMVMDSALAFSKQAEYIDRLAQTSGMSAKTIQQFGYALRKFGGDVSTAAMQLDHLETKLDRFRKPLHKGGGLASELARLSKKYKVDLRGVDSSINLLKALSVRMEKLSERKKLELARAFGLDESTFLLVKNGLKSLEESLYKAQKFILFDDKEIRQAKEFEDTLRDIADNITLISKSFSFGAIPQMQKFANIMRSVTDYMTEHKKVVEGIGLTAFGAGAYGIFRLLNFIPTKFLKASAGVFGTGLGLGAIGEEIDKIDRGNKNKTLVGTLESLGFEKSSKYLELIYRAINDVAFKKSFDGILNLLDKIGQDLGIETLQKKSQDNIKNNVDTTFKEYQEAFKKHGLTGLIARAMTSGDTAKERIDEFKLHKQYIEDTGGVLPFLLEKLGDALDDALKFLTNEDFWTPIFGKVDSLFSYIKGLFYDLMIYIKQSLGIDLSKTEKSHILKRQLQSNEQRDVDTVIQESSQAIANILNSDNDLISKKELIEQKVSELSGNIYKNYGNSGYSKQNIAARLLFNAGKKAFENGNLASSSIVDSYLNDIDKVSEDIKNEFTGLYKGYKQKKKQRIDQAAGALKETIDISDIFQNLKIEGVDLKKVSLDDFIDKIFQYASTGQVNQSLSRFKTKIPEDWMLHTLSNIEEQKPVDFSNLLNVKKVDLFKALTTGEGVDQTTLLGSILNWIKSAIEPITNFFKPISDGFNSFSEKAKPKLVSRIRDIVDDNKLVNSIDSGEKSLKDVSFWEVFKEAIFAEAYDFYENWISLDKAIERIGALIDEGAKLIKEINQQISNLKDKISEIVENIVGAGGAYTGWQVGTMAGSLIPGKYGKLIGGGLGALIGFFLGKEKAKEFFEEIPEIKAKELKDIPEGLKLIDEDGNIVEEGKSIVQGSANLEAIGAKVANSNMPVVNDNSQNNDITINQTFNFNKATASEEDIIKSVYKASEDGTLRGLRGATNNRAMGNVN